MSIFSGSTEITAANGIYSGAVPVQAVYSGATRVWVKEIISSLSSALSHTNSLTDTWDNPTRAYDGDLNTYASFSTGFGSTVDAGLDLTFPSISASEIVEVRLFVKGRGSSGVARNTTVAALSSGVGAHAAPQASTILTFPDGGFVTTYDSGLVATDKSLGVVGHLTEELLPENKDTVFNLITEDGKVVGKATYEQVGLMLYSLFFHIAPEAV
jgi:hypothetical protein